MPTRFLQQQQVGLFLLKFITMAPLTAGADAITNTINTPNVPDIRQDGINAISTRQHCQHAPRIALAVVILLLLGRNFGPSTITQDAHHLLRTRHDHHGPSVYKPPWPPPEPWAQFVTPAIHRAEGHRSHRHCFLSSVLDQAETSPARKQCSSEKFSQDPFGLGHLTSKTFRSRDNPSRPPISDIAERFRACMGCGSSLAIGKEVSRVQSARQKKLILLQNTPFATFCSTQDNTPSFTMTTRPSRKSPSSLLAATQASSARVRTRSSS